MNKNPNNDPRGRNPRNPNTGGNPNGNTKVYKSERPVNTSGYRTTQRAVPPMPDDATRVIPAVKNQPAENNNTYRYDPNQLYRVPPPDAAQNTANMPPNSTEDLNATRTIPVVQPQRTQNIRPPKYTGAVQDDSSTQVIPAVRPRQTQPQQQQSQPQPQRRPPQQQPQQQQNGQPVVRRSINNNVQNNNAQPGRKPPVRTNGTAVTNQNQKPNTARTQQRRPPDRNSKNSKLKSESAAPSVLSNVMKAVIYIVAVLVFSGFLSVYIIIVANDVFAFIKSDIEMDITISEYDNTSDIADKLYDFGVIKYPSIFRIYAKLRNQNDVYAGGTYTISPSMNYDQLFIELKGKNVARDQISLTIREGWTVEDVIDLFVSKEMGSRAEFVNVINNHDFDYWFVKELDNADLSSSRTYRLEGYLFPDTYYFYTDATEVAIIDKLLSNFNKKFVQPYREFIAGTQYTVDDMIIMASLIQAEARFTDEYGNISSVFHNRLNNPGYEYIGARLQCDATIQYVLAERKENLTAADLETDNPYNTRIHAGLPPGPIGNPSLNAIHFALEPAETDFYYFVSYPGGRTEFSATNAEHEIKKAEVAAVTAAAAN